MENAQTTFTTVKERGDMYNYDTTTIKEIVTHNFRAASVFEKYSLDFCCKGGKTIAAACSEKQLDPAVVIADLQSVNDIVDTSSQRFNQWEVDFLTSYIVENHHSYVRHSIPSILAHTQKVAVVHGERHPEMKEVANLFGVVAQDMLQHMHKEEQILFPYITAVARMKRETAPFLSSPFGTVRNPIAMMEQEHDAAGTLMFEIRELTKNYIVPEDGCTTYRVTLQELKEFEHDLHQHVHLENNILFPKTIALEEQLHNARRAS